MAAIEKRSVSNLIEVMADERWERLAEQQGIAYAKTVAEAMNFKVDMNTWPLSLYFAQHTLDDFFERRLTSTSKRERENGTTFIHVRRFCGRQNFKGLW
jgi:hypothetical protein